MGRIGSRKWWLQSDYDELGSFELVGDSGAFR